MNEIRSVNRFLPKKSNGQTIVYMHGYGGFTWEAKRQIRLLQREGYGILALDFRDVLRSKTPQGLIDLMDEAEQLLQREKVVGAKTILLGISLGRLVGFNMIQRFPALNKLIIITGGDMTHIPRKRSLKLKWKLSRDELSAAWSKVNIYARAGSIKDKHIVMILPLRDKLIDPDEVIREVNKHKGLNDVQLIRTPGGHLRTIIKQTIISPKSTLPVIKQLGKY